jgi:hypothetical protein
LLTARTLLTGLAESTLLAGLTLLTGKALLPPRPRLTRLAGFTRLTRQALLAPRALVTPRIMPVDRRAVIGGSGASRRRGRLVSFLCHCAPSS